MTQLSLDGSAPDPVAAPEETSALVKTMAPLARNVLEAVAIDHGVCIRPVPMRRVDLHTGDSEVINVPCGHTLASVCPPCAERKRKLRAVQCRQGWHLDQEPVITRADPDDEQRAWMGLRAQAQAEHDRAAEEGTAHGEPVEFWDGVLRELDGEIERSGVRARSRRVSTRHAVPGPRGGGRMLRTFPVGRWTRARSGRSTGVVTGRRSGPRCS
ncbi:replication initiator [Actinomadura sp. WMMB 499]|uniref:replication initiator n=1 Tax=Actinomadura sp. WMMB 499 TaxID=1219491 RepID=UPI0034A0B203